MWSSNQIRKRKGFCSVSNRNKWCLYLHTLPPSHILRPHPFTARALAAAFKGLGGLIVGVGKDLLRHCDAYGETMPWLPITHCILLLAQITHVSIKAQKVATTIHFL